MSNIEEWRKINGCENYSASSLGRIRRDTTRTSTVSGKILVGNINSHGYRYIVFMVDGKQWTRTVHRVVALAFLGDGTGKVVNHKNGNKLDNAITNLEFCSHMDNSQHAKRMGLLRVPTWERHGSHTHPERRPRGERHGSHTKPWSLKRGEENHLSKLESSDIVKIRAAFANGAKRKDLAALYGVSRSNIEYIINRKSWAHIA